MSPLFYQASSSDHINACYYAGEGQIASRFRLKESTNLPKITGHIFQAVADHTCIDFSKDFMILFLTLKNSCSGITNI